MKNNRRRNSLQWRMIAAMMLAAVMLAGMTGCGRQTEPSATVETMDVSTVEVTTDNIPAIGIDEQIDYDSIATPFCLIQYPAHLMEYVEVQETILDNMIVESFYCNIAQRQYELFSVFWGGNVDGELLGTITVDGVKQDVRFVLYEFSGDSSLTPDETAVVYAVLDSANDVIQSIMTSVGYEPA